jgi:hypothetical protein
MQALAHKLDSAVKDAWSATKDTVQDKIGQVTRHLEDGKQTVQNSAQEVTRQAKSLTGRAQAQVGEPVAGRIDQLTQAVRQRPVPAAAIGLAVLVLLLLRLFRGTA